MDDYKEDIYADLPDINLGDEISKLQQTNQQLLEHIANLEKEISRLNDELARMKNVQSTLEVNISELFKTAKTEIERKDRRIADLRRELDDVIMRRMDKDSFYARKRERERELEEGEIAETKRKRQDDFVFKNEQHARYKDARPKGDFRRNRFDDRLSYKQMRMQETSGSSSFRSSSMGQRSTNFYESCSKDTKARGDTKDDHKKEEKTSSKVTVDKNQHKSNQNQNKKNDHDKTKDKVSAKAEDSKNEKGAKAKSSNIPKPNSEGIKNKNKESSDTNNKNNKKKVDKEEEAKSAKVSTKSESKTVVEKDAAAAALAMVKEELNSLKRNEKPFRIPLIKNLKESQEDQNISKIITKEPDATNSVVNTTNDELNSFANTTVSSFYDTPSNSGVFQINTVVSVSGNRPKRRRCVMTFKD